MLTKKSKKNRVCEHYGLNTILRIIFGKVFQVLKNGQK
jgi:hypothetical protein